MLKYPPQDFLEKAVAGGKDLDKRDAWMVCMIIPIINAGLIKYKDVNCPANYNKDQSTYHMHPPSVAYGRPDDACSSCKKKFDGGAYAETQLVDRPGKIDDKIKWKGK